MVYNSNKVIIIKRGRVIINGRRVRPRCPECQTALGQKWESCEGCNTTIAWED